MRSPVAKAKFGTRQCFVSPPSLITSPSEVLAPHVDLWRSVPPSVLAHALSGALGALAAEAAVFPVDTVKLITQTAPSAEAKGFFATFADVLRERGVAGLYKGLLSALLTEGIHSFNYWAWHGFLFRRLTRWNDTTRTPPAMRLLLNMLAKQLNWVCTVPFEVVSTMNQVLPNSPGFIATAAMLYREGGVARFYRGLFVSMALAINPAVMHTLITGLLGAAARLRTQFFGEDHTSARAHPPALIGAITAASKIVSTLLTYPLIRAKVLQQTRKGYSTQSPFVILREILSSEGAPGLYRGLLALSYKAVLWNAFMMMVKSSLGPKRPTSPPQTPQAWARNVPAFPLMGRDAFNDEASAKRLEEILAHLKRGRRGQLDERIAGLEERLAVLRDDLHEVRNLLLRLVALRQPPSITRETTPKFGRPGMSP